MNKLILIPAIFGACLAHAQMTITQKDVGFSQSQSEIPANGEMLFAYDLKSSNDWSADVQSEAELFPGFKSFETWIVTKDTNETIVYRSETALVIDKNLDAIDLKKLESVNLMNSIDPAFKHSLVSADEVNQAFATEMKNGFASAKDVLTSLWSRKKITPEEYDTYLDRAETQLEANLKANWCQGGSTCVLSKAAFPTSTAFTAMISAANGIGMEVPNSLDLYTQITPLSQEAAAKMGAEAGVVQLGVLANKFMVNMKNVILLKKISDTQTLVTIQATAVFEKDDLDRLSLFGSYDTLIGMGAANQDEGILMGLPALNQKLAEGLKNSL